MITYDNIFNWNEWFVIGGLCLSIAVLFLLPRRFTSQTTVIYFLTGVVCGFFFDHSLSVLPVSFYDVNDTSQFQLIDFISYWMYGGLSYVYFYLYDQFGIRARWAPLYILIWSMIAFAMEWLAWIAGVFHYRHGYQLVYSFPIYLIVLSSWVILYYKIKQSVRLS